MPASDPRRRLPGRRQLRPTIDGLESRELPSTAALAAALHSMARRPAAVVARPMSPSGLLGSRAPGPFVNPALLRQIAATLYPASSPPGSPTPAELRRQTFTARWEGQYTIGPPRFADRASTIHLWGTSGGANQFLRGKLDAALFPPADPTATPTPGNPYANQVTGFAALFGESYLQSGSQLFLDMNGAPAAGSTPGALPHQLTWAYDVNTSGGPYAAPGGVVPGSGYTRGAGIVQFQWMPDAHPQRGTLGSGHVVITFQGLLQTSQLVSGVSKLIS